VKNVDVVLDAKVKIHANVRMNVHANVIVNPVTVSIRRYK
jgi:hypothetical protein